MYARVCTTVCVYAQVCVCACVCVFVCECISTCVFVCEKETCLSCQVKKIAETLWNAVNNAGTTSALLWTGMCLYSRGYFGTEGRLWGAGSGDGNLC